MKVVVFLRERKLGQVSPPGLHENQAEVFMRPVLMANRVGWSTSLSRVIHEVLFTFNLAVLVTLAKSLTTRFVLLQWVKGFFVRRTYSDNYDAGYPAFFAIAIVLAAVFFVLLRLLRRSATTTEVLRSVAIVPALAGLPLVWLYAGIKTWYNTGYLSIEGGQSGYYLEAMTSIVCAFLYLSGRWSIPGLGAIILLAIHYSFWVWVAWRLSFSNTWSLAVPVVGLCSCIAWIGWLALDKSGGVVKAQ